MRNLSTASPLHRRRRLHRAALAIACLASVGAAAYGGEPVLRAEGGEHALQDCISGVAGLTESNASTEEQGRKPFFADQAAAQRRDGRGYFAAWVSRDDDAPVGEHVDFLFYQDESAAENGIAAARKYLIKRGYETPDTAERHGNLVMYYTNPLPGAQRSAIEGCLQDAGADGEGDRAAILSPTDRKSVEERRAAEDEELKRENLAAARDPKYVNDVRAQAVEWCLKGKDGGEGKSRVDLATVPPGYADLKLVAPELTQEISRIHGGTYRGYRFPDPKERYQVREQYELPQGWDFIYLPDAATAERLQDQARAEVTEEWPEGSVLREGSVLTLLARSFPESSKAVLSTCLQEGQQAVDKHLREAEEANQ